MSQRREFWQRVAVGAPIWESDGDAVRAQVERTMRRNAATEGHVLIEPVRFVAEHVPAGEFNDEHYVVSASAAVRSPGSGTAEDADV